MKRVEFRLSMPGVASWNGRWSGEGKNYIITKSITDKKAKELFGDKKSRSWSHAWSDGWRASVSGRIMEQGERSKKSDGFYGYNWMVDDIIFDGERGNLLNKGIVEVKCDESEKREDEK